MQVYPHWIRAHVCDILFQSERIHCGGQILATEGGRVEIEVVAQNSADSIHSLRKENSCNPNLINTRVLVIKNLSSYHNIQTLYFYTVLSQCHDKVVV